MKIVLISMMLLSSAAFAKPKVVRATDMGSKMWSEVTNGKISDVIIEFREGDELPVTFEAKGDLVETRQASVSYVGVNKNFWLRPTQNNIEISLDGANFKRLNEVLDGSLEAGAGTSQNGGVANSINIIFKAFLKAEKKTKIGIGVALEKLDDGTVLVDALIPNAPAERAGILKGDIFHQIKSLPNGEFVDVRSLTLEEVVMLIRGEEGVPVEITYARGDSQPTTISIVREKFEYDDE